MKKLNKFQKIVSSRWGLFTLLFLAIIPFINVFFKREEITLDNIQSFMSFFHIFAIVLTAIVFLGFVALILNIRLIKLYKKKHIFLLLFQIFILYIMYGGYSFVIASQFDKIGIDKEGSILILTLSVFLIFIYRIIKLYLLNIVPIDVKSFLGMKNSTFKGLHKNPYINQYLMAVGNLKIKKSLKIIKNILFEVIFVIPILMFIIGMLINFPSESITLYIKPIILYPPILIEIWFWLGLVQKPKWFMKGVA